MRCRHEYRTVHSQTYTIWGSAHSLFTGKVRSYLIKKQLRWVELNPSDRNFAARILPVVRHRVIPVLETQDGEIIQDTADIIDFLEARHKEPCLDPTTPVQKAISALFDAVGSEYLLALAMHYRWSYREQQESFLTAEFGRALHAGGSREARRNAVKPAMAYFASALPSLGVRAETIAAMEASYRELIEALDLHFHWHPYLLGGRPCRGDFGMMASLYAHLGRDPVPRAIMQRHAPNLARWTERMNLAPIHDGEYPGYADDWAENDSIPETLEAVLALVFRDWSPGLVADAACFNRWADDKPSGALVSLNGERKVHPSIGQVRYDWNGVEIERASAPHGLWHFSKVLELVTNMNGVALGRFDALVQRTGGAQAMGITLSKRMTRADNALVLE